MRFWENLSKWLTDARKSETSIINRWKTSKFLNSPTSILKENNLIPTLTAGSCLFVWGEKCEEQVRFLQVWFLQQFYWNTIQLAVALWYNLKKNNGALNIKTFCRKSDKIAIFYNFVPLFNQLEPTKTKREEARRA